VFVHTLEIGNWKLETKDNTPLTPSQEGNSRPSPLPEGRAGVGMERFNF